MKQGIKGIEENLPDLEKAFGSLGLENNIQRELRKIRRARVIASYCLGAATGMIITYIILKLI